MTLSGFVSVFFEKVLKSRVVNLSVWDRNFQVSKSARRSVSVLVVETPKATVPGRYCCKNFKKRSFLARLKSMKRRGSCFSFFLFFFLLVVGCPPSVVVSVAPFPDSLC